jgi:periplasmic protein TonB
VGLGFLYRSHLPPVRSGSAPGAPTLTLQTMVIVSPPSQPPPPQPPKPAPAVSTIPALPAPAPTVTTTTPPPKPAPAVGTISAVGTPAVGSRPAPPEATVPVLAIQPGKPIQALQSPAAKISATSHPAISHTATAASPSSYAPGPSLLPHPPYPTEARDRGQTGTVIMDVQFDVKGDVADARVAQSSGVPLLDTATRSFIRAHWHSLAYAGQAVSVPVQYTLQNL